MLRTRVILHDYFKMKHSREFEIAWQGLKSGISTFQYDIDDKFMQERVEEQEFKDWKAVIGLTFDKKSNFFMLHFDVDGVVTVPCDRCGDDFPIKLWDEFDLVIKLTGEDAKEIEEEDDVVFIPRSETVLDISKWLYEFVMLSVPLQHIHPDINDLPGCNPVALSLLNQLSAPADEERNTIWQGLEQFKETEKENVKRSKHK
jgi:uncharacterized metal-binding protein YceD (DUF177 family)